MQCVNPIKVPVNSKRIYTDYRQKLVNYVPCGKCYACRFRKTQDLMVRAYYHDCKYTIFDTLTYDEDNVNTYNGIRVLCYKDYQDFMKRFRRNCERAGYKVDDDIKYVVAGEYGTKRTKRPHMHVLLFINADINPVELSRLVKKSWKLGLTDGVDDKGLHYFLSQRVFKDYQGKYNTVGYICKYMTKTGSYDNIVERALRLEIGETLKELKIAMSCEDINEQLKKMIKPYQQFVRWSKGFGKEFMNDFNNIKRYEDKNYIQIRTDLKSKKYSLPLYYRRKMYYQYDKKYDEWQLNERGKSMIERKLHNEFENNKRKLLQYTELNDQAINEVSYYWTYLKDRKKGYSYVPDYNGSVLWNENSIKDRKVYPKGKVLVDGKEITTDLYIKKSLENVEEFDRIIETVNKKINDQSRKVLLVEEYNKNVRKNI